MACVVLPFVLCDFCYICPDADKSVGWYNSIRPALKNLLKSRPVKKLGNILTGFFKKAFNSLWMGEVRQQWDALIEWIRSRDPVST